MVLIEDYNKSIAKNTQNHTEEKIDIPKSNVLIYYTEDGTKIAARPSGTEPKIKFYISVNKELQSIQDYTTEDKKLSAKIARIKEELKLG